MLTNLPQIEHFQCVQVDNSDQTYCLTNPKYSHVIWVRCDSKLEAGKSYTGNIDSPNTMTLPIFKPYSIEDLQNQVFAQINAVFGENTLISQKIKAGFEKFKTAHPNWQTYQASQIFGLVQQYIDF